MRNSVLPYLLAGSAIGLLFLCFLELNGISDELQMLRTLMESQPGAIPESS